MTEKYGSNFGHPGPKSKDGSLVKKSKPSSTEVQKVAIFLDDFSVSLFFFCGF